MRIVLEVMEEDIGFGRSRSADINIKFDLKMELYVENDLGFWELVLGTLLTFEGEFDVRVDKEVLWPTII